MGEYRLTRDGSFGVLVIGMSGYSSEEETHVMGFPTQELAQEYARRRTRDSLEELRTPGISDQELREQWYLFGEDCIVIGQEYTGASEIDYFIAHNATDLERDWQGLERAL
jgi:hypothetical protein